jgi:hypothetical protein
MPMLARSYFSPLAIAFGLAADLLGFAADPFALAAGRFGFVACFAPAGERPEAVRRRRRLRFGNSVSVSSSSESPM